MQEKVKPENLVHSMRSPVVPLIDEEEKRQATKELDDKAKKKAANRAERLDKEKAKTEKAKKQPEAKKPQGRPKGSGKVKEPIGFPVSVKINHYGFLNFRKSLLDALGWTVDLKLTLEKNSDGSITLRKA